MPIIEDETGNVTVKASDSSSPASGGALSVRGGDQTSGDNNGGQVVIAGGKAFGDTQQGGNVLLLGGESAGGDGLRGDIFVQAGRIFLRPIAYIQIANLATSDPHIHGVLWASEDGIVRVSAG